MLSCAFLLCLFALLSTLLLAQKHQDNPPRLPPVAQSSSLSADLGCFSGLVPVRPSWPLSPRLALLDVLPLSTDNLTTSPRRVASSSLRPLPSGFLYLAVSAFEVSCFKLPGSNCSSRQSFALAFLLPSFAETSCRLSAVLSVATKTLPTAVYRR